MRVIDSRFHHYQLNPDKDYVGKDHAVYQIEAQGKRYKVTVNFWIVPVVSYPKGDEPYVPECHDQKFDGSAIDPASIMGQTSPALSDGANAHDTGYLVSSYVMGGLPFGDGKINVKIVDLLAGAVGQTTSNTITLDLDADGHGWFIDSTPYDNDEFLPTSNPNEWIAKPGSEAAGKMDMLTVLMHEYGHVLGLDKGREPGTDHGFSVAAQRVA